jgi:putative SOS response-associated peptidase YedK
MCYKIAVTSEASRYEKRFGTKFKPEYEHTLHYHANGFSHPSLPVITQKDPDIIQAFEWGLIPSFAKDTAHAKKLRIGNLNARDDNAFTLVSWKNSIRKRRCLVLADGFYESMDVNGIKFPHFIYRKDNEPFAFAGLYNPWKDENDIWHPTFSIVTTEPNELMRKIHNIKLRMPVILPPDKERRWLSNDLLDEEITDLMVPLEDGILAAHPVNKDLNKTAVDTNNAQILEVCEYPELGLL